MYDRCHVFELNYSSYRWEELATWDRESDIPNNTRKVKCEKWVYDKTHVISNAVTEVSIYLRIRLKPKKDIGVFPRCFTEFAEFSDKKYVSLQ